MTRRSEALQRICPVCNAFAGQSCVGVGGPRKSVHQERFSGELATPTRRAAGGLLSEQDLIEQEIMTTVEWHEEHLRLQIAAACRACDSPIERVFVSALVVHSDMQTLGDPIYISTKPRTGLPVAPFDGLHVYPQVSIDGYRLDFLALYKSGDDLIVTVIELDGHDYHERTKQQASHDKKRDRHFTKKGWQVLRYTGSDVWRSPSECAREAIWTAVGIGEEA